MFIDYFILAFRNIKGKGIRSWLTLVGIFIGIMSVVALIGLGGAMRTAITSQFDVNQVDVLTIQAGGLSGAGPPGTGVVKPLTLDDAEEIDKLRSIDFAIPRIIHTVQLEFNDYTSIEFSGSVPLGEQRDFFYGVFDFKTEQGRLLKDGDKYKIVLGYNFLDTKTKFGKNLQVGDKVLLSGQQFEIIGFLEKEGSFILDSVVLINEDTMRDFFDIPERTDLIVARVKDIDKIDEAQSDIERLLRKRRDVREGEEDFSVTTPAAMLESLNQILLGVQVFIVIIAAVSIVVGAIGIINTMFMAVLERRRQIGIMKSIGARNSDIFFQFFIESGIMGFIGGAIGCLLGVIISLLGTLFVNSWIGSTIAPTVNIPLVVGALIGSFVIGSIAGIIPAMQAAYQSPVEALRG